MKEMHQFLDKRGFTLIELIIVIAIIGILAGIAVPVFLGQRQKTYVLEAETNLDALRALQEEFLAENGRYAPWIDRTSPTSVGMKGYEVSGGANGLQTIFPAFKPGKGSDLYFEYYCLSQGSGSRYCCWATPKAKTPTGPFYRNQTNETRNCTADK